MTQLVLYRDKCSFCKAPFNLILEGKISCPYCYEFFQPEMSAILKQIQGSNQHIGKRPKHAISDDPDMDPGLRKFKLHEALKAAIKREDYETAAKVRDFLKNS